MLASGRIYCVVGQISALGSKFRIKNSADPPCSAFRLVRVFVIGVSMRSTAWAFGVLGFATSGWGQQPYSVVGAADYSSGTTVGIPRGSIFTVVFPPPGPSLAGVRASVFAAPLPLVFDGVSVGLWTAPAGAGTLLAQSPLLFTSRLRRLTPFCLRRLPLARTPLV
jgi:hypothetical protein